MVQLRYPVEAFLSACAYALLWWAWWMFLRGRKSVRLTEPDFQILLTSTFMWAQIFLTVLALGFTSALYRPALLGLNFGIAACLVVIAWRTGTRQERAGSTPRPVDFRATIRTVPRALGLTLLAGGLMFCWFALLNVMYPTGSYDDFVYHLPSATYFVQHHSFRFTNVAPVQSGINHITKLSELFCVWQCYLVRDDGLVTFWTLGFFVQYLVAAYGLCRELGAGAREALFGTVLSSVTPVLMFQTLSASNDLPMCALFATALRFAAASSRGFLQRLTVAISCGLMLSSKFSAPLLIAVVFVVFAIYERPEVSPRNAVQSAKAIAWMGMLTLLLGGWWYLRNELLTHDPFYPFSTKLAGFNFPGPISASAEMSILNRELSKLPLPVRLWKIWREEKSHFNLWLYNTESAYAGFGPVFFILGLPGLAIAPILTLIERRWRPLAVMCIVICAYLTFSGNIGPRLSLFILPVVAVAIALTVRAAGKVSSFLCKAIYAVGFGLTFYTFLAAGMSPFDPLSVRRQILKPQRKDLVPATFMNFFAPIRDAIPANAIVAYDQSTDFIWPLWRSDWKNRVEYIPTADGWESWKARAGAIGVTHVKVGRENKSAMSEWVLRYPEQFRVVAKTRFGELYEYRH